MVDEKNTKGVTFKKDGSVSYKDTLNLPHTDFPIHYNGKVTDPLMLKRWSEEDLYKKSFEHNKGKEKYILHDGPPYANGHLHLGHAYNKILKDMVCKVQRMSGKHVPVTPGWDCHGLPIERKVTEENKELTSPQEIKKACRAYAEHWINVQRGEFKDLGVLMDWANPYLTMAPGYEASTLRAFASFVAQGFIEKKNKTVPWCITDQTVLASAEIEYQDRKDPSIYVRFPLVSSLKNKLFPAYADKEVSVLLWTTTPWTLALNRAVVVHPQAEYVLLEAKEQYVLIGKSLATKLCATAGVTGKIVGEISSADLVGGHVEHPFIPDFTVPLILDGSVLLDDGTAFVSNAPGAGPEDYEIGVRNNLEIYSPVAADGTYTKDIQPQELVGLTVAQGQSWVLKKLTENGRLFFKNSITHAYPHCWRCHNGLIFRATKQWFCDLSKGNLKQKSIAAIDGITMLPETSANRLKATLDGRLEWCLSRQRVWGVPIPALLCESCDHSYTSPEFIQKVAEHVEREGIEYWDTADIASLVAQGFACPHCKGTAFKKETDILDVWFDSGISHYAVLKKNPALRFPADIYLEGKDQHRGWFQSSLLTSMALEEKACMKMIMTHGFTVDEKGRKMSKSLGNVVSPFSMIEKLGTDGLRLWVSSIDCTSEAVVSETLMRNVQEVFRKIRNTSRNMLANLYDFEVERDVLALDALMPMDRMALERLVTVHEQILKKYQAYDFTAVFHLLAEYCAGDLSALYMDIAKDRLYVAHATAHERRSAQTAYWYILDALIRLMAPILSFTAEELSDFYQKNKKNSIHLQNFADISPLVAALKAQAETFASGTKTTEEFLAFREQQINALIAIRTGILKALESKREQGLIKHSLEAAVSLYIDPAMPEYEQCIKPFFEELAASGYTPAQFFKEFLIVSEVTLQKNTYELEQASVKGLWVAVRHAPGEKCPRCWQWTVTTHEHKLCSRCQKVVE